MNILIRNIPDAIAQRISAQAQESNQSQQEMLMDLLIETYSAPPAVIAWFKSDRRGEVEIADCPECGQPMEDLWVALLSNGQWIAPRCRWCATSE